jgi:hypothetical protein
MKRKRSDKWSYDEKISFRLAVVLFTIALMIFTNLWLNRVESQSSCIDFDQTAQIQWGFMEHYTDSSTSQVAIDYLSHMQMIPIQGNPTITHRPVDVQLMDKHGVLGSLQMLYSEPGQLWMVHLQSGQINCGLYQVDIHDLIQFLHYVEA